jgi:hypothetical protein
MVYGIVLPYTFLIIRGESEDEWIHHRKSHHWIGLRQPREKWWVYLQKSGTPKPNGRSLKSPGEMAWTQFSDTPWIQSPHQLGFSTIPHFIIDHSNFPIPSKFMVETSYFSYYINGH